MLNEPSTLFSGNEIDPLKDHVPEKQENIFKRMCDQDSRNFFHFPVSAYCLITLLRSSMIFRR